MSMRHMSTRFISVAFSTIAGLVVLTPTQAMTPRLRPITGADSLTTRPHRFASYRLTSVATYTLQPDQNLPHSTAATIGRHIIIERVAVRDSTHYRVDVQTVAPGIDSGTLTVTLAGRRMEAYDSRTGEAAWNLISGPPPHPSDIDLSLSISPMGPTPDPAQTFRQFLASLHQPASVLHPTVKITGHTHLLGHPVAILDYGALVGTGQSVCPRPSRHHRHPLCSSVTGTGRARLWVATDRPVLLRYTEGHFTGMPTEMLRQQYLYRVTSYRAGPVSLAATRYTPPVHAIRTRWLQMSVIGGGDSGWFGGWPAPWRTGGLYRAYPPSNSHGSLYTEDGVFIRRDSLIPEPSAMGVLYYRPKPSASPGMPPSQYHGSGPYVYLQERMQVHGLPAALRHGHHVHRGRCNLWTGSFGKGVAWMALSRQRIAMLVTSNALSRRDLIRYGFASLC
jgi:hypothetical protein